MRLTLSIYAVFAFKVTIAPLAIITVIITTVMFYGLDSFLSQEHRIMIIFVDIIQYMDPSNVCICT
jgi:hypothetical protein